MPQSVTSGDKWEYARVTRLKRSGFVFQSFILVLALCADTFGAGLAYGANRIRVGFGKVLFLNGICSVCLGLAMDSRLFCRREAFGYESSHSLRRKPYFYGIVSSHGLFPTKMDPDALGERTQLLLFSFRYPCAYTDLE